MAYVSVCHRIRPVDDYCGHCGAEMDLEKYETVERKETGNG